MKALDAGVLVALLEGDPLVRPLLRELRGHEIAATEISLLELASRAAEGALRGRPARRLALERLRRKLTVLPIDARATAEAARRVPAAPRKGDLARLLEWGALEAYGCETLYTRLASRPAGHWRFKVIRVPPR
jgi:predicted nucleic acid-binding protein